ncbi:MAG: tRNA (adenosine(37)-N6)-threonylcarbamoyltransferase complex ATPase subunit type 1 TsaE [Treponema sp.]|jgi:tRNA threonylcarbamoyladenosine biosynthesis protein TsaE|nr:tRNA (adenosine(37)-N6)-threonylcarbamoyltransferase complex ATPase subunit type 1 TsaE [Treponema sp.]
MVSNSAEETFAFGQHIASLLKSGSVAAVSGELGSGKTCLAKGIAAALGITENITSPTYTIISEYQIPNTPVNFYHIDAYRLNNDDDFGQIGGTEIINGGGISVIEWSERIANSLPPDSIHITIEITGPASRLIKINCGENP